VIRTNASTQAFFVGDTPWTNNQSAHIALVQSGAGHVLYVNGASQTLTRAGTIGETNALAWWSGTTAVGIGDRWAATYPPSAPWPGIIYDARLYQRGMTAAEVGADYTNSRARHP
jgi:hypothetical protein